MEPRRVGGPKFRAFFPSSATIFFLLSLSWGPFVEFWWCLKRGFGQSRPWVCVVCVLGVVCVWWVWSVWWVWCVCGVCGVCGGCVCWVGVCVLGVCVVCVCWVCVCVLGVCVCVCVLGVCAGCVCVGCVCVCGTRSTSANCDFGLFFLFRPNSTNFDFGQFLDVEFLDQKRWAPEGWRPKPRRRGVPKSGAPEGSKGGAPKGGRPKITRFFPLPPLHSSFLGGLLVEFWWCLKRRGGYTFWSSLAAAGVSHDSPRAQTCTFEGLEFKNHHQIPRHDPQERKKE